MGSTRRRIAQGMRIHNPLVNRSWQVDEETKAKRLKEWHAVEHPLKAKRGVLYRYARDVAVSSNYTNKKWLL